MKLLGILLLSLVPALARASADDAALRAQMRRIVDWLSESVELPPARALPRVVRVSPERMRAVRLQGGHHPPAAEGAGRIEALYEDASRTIYLPRGWTGATPAEVSVLVHELAHHLQNMAGLKYACAEARERPAYVAQDRWLRRSGRNLIDEFQLDPMTVLVRTHCMH